MQKSQKMRVSAELGGFGVYAITRHLLGRARFYLSVGERLLSGLASTSGRLLSVRSFKSPIGKKRQVQITAKVDYHKRSEECGKKCRGTKTEILNFVVWVIYCSPTLIIVYKVLFEIQDMSRLSM